ncbi:hypothetical protein F4779DRAFT_523949 [Xylariaceae sp. FL0662B]|nr:hypothetical protein F4779DRAFT_523949 [Xylariaceae sp. FL0662B]
MEALAAVSLCCNVLDLTDRSLKIYRAFRRIYNSADGQDHGKLQQFLRSIGEAVEGLRDNRNQLARANNNPQDDAISGILSRIDELCEALQRILDECKAKKPQSLRATAKAMFKSWQSQDKLDQYEAELERCREDLNTLLAVDASKHFRKVLGFLKASESAHKEERVSLETILGNLTNTESKTGEILEQLRLGRDISAEVGKKAYAQNILNALGKPGDRYEEVQEAAEHTFEWLFDASNRDSSEDGISVSSYGDSIFARARSTQFHASTKFNKWLTEDAGFFHISGKPGAGKSTLMKHISEHKVTRELLLEWAGPKQLILTKFFFWKAGDWRQNTLRGLVRGLLYDILSKAPKLSSIIFPEKSIEYSQYFDPTLGLSSFTLSDKDCREALSRLVEEQTLSNDMRLCLFIDGLDEFAEEHNGISHEQLVRILRQWAYNSGGRMKLCVSSRELPAFEGISPSNKLCLQDLTRSDIQTYVRDALMEHSGFLDLQKTGRGEGEFLIREIVQNAEGVFLWVALVVRSVLKGLSNGDAIPKLRKRFKDMPRSLDGLFDNMLKSIEDCYLYEVTLILAIIMRLHRIRLDGRQFQTQNNIHSDWLSLFRVYLFFKALDKYGSLELVFAESEAEQIGNISYGALQGTKLQIIGRFNGLLSVHGLQAHHFEFGGYIRPAVRLTHRSIIEFMERHVPTMAARIGLSDSDVERAMCWMLAADIGHGNLYENNLNRCGEMKPHLSFEVEYNVQQWGKNISHLLECLKPSDGSIPDEALELLDLIHRHYRMRIHFVDHKCCVLREGTIQTEKDGIDFFLVGLACACGLNQYVAWRFAHCPPLVQGSYEEEHLLDRVAMANRRDFLSAAHTFSILVKHGANINCMVTIGRVYSMHELPGHNFYLMSTFDAIWVKCLSQYRSPRSNHAALRPFVEDWLKQGATPCIYLVTQRVTETQTVLHIRYLPESCASHNEQLDYVPDDVTFQGDHRGWLSEHDTITFEDAIKILYPDASASILALLHDRNRELTMETHPDTTPDSKDAPNADIKLIEYESDKTVKEEKGEQPPSSKAAQQLPPRSKPGRRDAKLILG